MPTNLLRRSGDVQRPRQEGRGTRAGRRLALVRAGKASLRIELAATATADRIWAALPINSTAQTWGQAVHFETPVETGRERGARINVSPGDICYWSEDNRVLIAFGATPISGAAGIRLPAPCNVWAQALDDVAALASVRPGERVSITVLAVEGEEGQARHGA